MPPIKDSKTLAADGADKEEGRRSAKGVMFITIEDETGIANLVIWPKLFEKQRRIILSAGLLAVDGRIQREGEVVHLVARRLADLSRLLASVGNRNLAVSPPHGRVDTKASADESNLVDSTSKGSR